MDSSEELECTQVLQDSDHGEPQDRFETEKLHVGRLEINATQFPVFNGDTFIGRDPKRCSIILDRKSISSHHALIEVESGHHLICDLGSSNSTRLNGILLKPHVRYNLTNDANVQFADLKGIYKIEPSRAISCDTSSDDIFATPARSKIGSTPRNSSLNFSGDESVIGSTPMRSSFKQPLPRTSSKPSHRDSDSFYQQATSYQSATNTPVSNSSKIDIYEAETQTEEESDTSLFNDTVDDSTCQKVISSFVVPCTQEVSGNSSIQLHYEADQSINDCSVESHKEGTSLIEEKAASSIKLDDSRSKKGVELDGEELSDVEQKFIEEEMERIERSMSSEMLENSTTVTALQNEERSTGRDLINNKNPSEVRRETKSIHSPNQATKLSNCNITGTDNICETEPQIVDTVSSDSKPDDEGVNGPGAEILRNKNEIHDAKTQKLMAPTDNDDIKELGTSTIDSKSAGKSLNIHEAATQIVDTVASDSETDDKGVYGACTEAPRTKDDIHDAKTQMFGAPTDNDDIEEQATTSVENKNAGKSANIHEAATQIVDTVDSDSETDDEGVYGACTEAPRTKDDIHGAETQMLQAPTDYDDSEKPASSSVKSNTVGKSVNIHDAATQIVDTVDSDSETDDEGVYGACTEAPRTKDDIHDAKTQMFGAPTDNDDIEEQATTSVENKNAGKSANIHEAATQIVDTVDSDSETDDEGVYGACTEAPRTKDDIHDAKTQMFGAPTDNDDIEEQATTSVENKNAGKSVNIHEAATQIVDTVDSDSETDDEGVYGACTEAPRTKDDIHDAKTQMLEAPTDNDGGVVPAPSSVESKTAGKSVNIHEAATQIVDTVDSDSETDDEGVYGACTEAPRTKDDIHDAKTQMLEAPTDNDGGGVPAPSSVESKTAGKSVNIHEAATQIVDTVASDSETDDEGVYGACTEAPTKMDDVHDAETQMLQAPTDYDDSEKPASSSVKSNTVGKSVNIHEAATQIVDTVDSDSETDDEGVYGACTEAPRTKDDIHDAKTHMFGAPTDNDDIEEQATTSVENKNAGKSVNIHEAATQIVDTVDSDSETDDEGVYGACTEAPRTKDDIHDAKTQMLEAPTDNDGGGVPAPSLVESKTAGKSVNIHEAATQIVDTVDSDSETDDEGVYGACTEAPTKMDDLHDAETQMLQAPTDCDDSEKPASSSVKSNTVGKSVNIHEAATQIVDTVDSDSETDDEGLYGACTKAPRKMDDIHDAKTQMLEAPTDNDGGGVPAPSSVESKTAGKSVNIHEAATQIVDTVASDSETDDDGVYGAKNVSHDTKTPMLEAPTDIDDGKEHATSLVKSKIEGKDENIHDAATQIVDTVASVSETDDQGVYGAGTEVVKSKDDINDAKTPTLDEGTKINGIEDPATSSINTKNTQAKKCSPKKRLSLCRMKKKHTGSAAATHFMVTQENPVNVIGPEEDLFSAATQLIAQPVENHGSSEGTDEKEDFCSAATQILCSPGRRKPVRGGRLETGEDAFNAATPTLPNPHQEMSAPDVKSPEKEDIFTAATQILPSPSRVKPLADGQSREEDDIFSAATQILPCPGSTKSVSCDQKKICPAATQVLCSPSSSKSIPPEMLNAKKRTSSSPSAKKIGIVALPEEGDNGIIPKSAKKVSKSPGYIPSTLAPNLNTKAEDRGVSDQIDEHCPKVSNVRQVNRTRTTRQRSQPHNSKKIKMLGSSSPEADIENTSSDSVKSIDHMIDDDDDNDNLHDLAVITSKTLQKPTSGTKKEKILSPTVLTASLKAVSPVIGRSSGRRTLSLSRSRCSNVSEFETSTKEKTTDLHLSDSQAGSSAITQHTVPGVTPLISVTSEAAADPLPFENGSHKVKKERLRRSVRNNQNIALKMEADEKPASNDCISEEICNSNEMTTSILKLKPEAGSSRKSVSFVTSNTVTSTENVEEEKKSSKSENIKKTSSSSLPIHIQCGKNEVPDDKLNEDPGLPPANVKSNKTGKQKGYCKANQESSRQKKSDSQDSCLSEGIDEGEISEPNQTASRKSSREKKQPATLEIKKESKINDESVDFAKPKPAQRNQRTSKRKAENVPLTEEVSSQTSNSSQESSASDIGTRRSTRAKKQRISESSDDGSIVECQAKRPSQSRKAKNASNISLASSSESLTSISDVEPQTATRKSSRSRKLPTKLIEDITETSQEQSLSKTTSRKGAQKNKEGESIEKKESSVNSIADGGRGRRSSNKKLAVPEEEETKVKGVKRLPAPLCEKDNVAGPSKISRRSTTLKPVLETTLGNSVLDNSLLSPSLKRGQDESFASDVEHEIKFPKGRRNSVASSSTSPRRSPRPRQSLKGTATNTAHVLFSFLNNPRHESLVKQLGGVIVDSVESADVLVTDKLRRTVKLLCFLGKGLPIVGPPWLLHSKAAGRLLDPWEHILTDQESEIKFNANLSESLKKSGQNPILKGYHIYVTKNVKPIPEEIKAIVTSCGGVILPRAPSVWPANSIAISCVEDKTTWTKYTKKIPIVSPEWLLQGALRQQLNLEDHRLN